MKRFFAGLLALLIPAIALAQPVPAPAIPLRMLGAANGVAQLGATGKLPLLQSSDPLVTLRTPRATDDLSLYLVGQMWNLPPNVFSAQRVSPSGYGAWAPIPSALPLDSVGGAAAAYASFRLSTTYVGNAATLTRSTDSTTKAIGFRSDGSLDTGTADSFCAPAWAAVGGSCRWTTWNDQSGNARDAAQTTFANAPAYTNVNYIGNVRSVVFDTNIASAGVATQESLVIPVGMTATGNNVSVVSLMRFTNTGWGSPVIQINGPDASHPQTFGNLIASATIAVNAEGTNTTLGWRPPVSPIVVGYASASTGLNLIWENGVYSKPALPATALAGGTIGQSAFLANVSGWNEMGALIIYPTAITAAQQSALRAALYGSAGIQPQVRDVLVFDGDSITEGTLSTFLQSYPRKVERLLPSPFQIFNTALHGDNMCNRLTLYPSRVAPMYVAGARNNILSIFAGTNDIAVLSSTAATIYGCLTNYVALAHATGWKVVVGTMLPRAALGTTAQATWTSYVAMIRANTAGADVIADFQADPTMGPFAAASNTSLYGDGTHPTDFGYNYIAQIESAAITSLLK